MMKWLAWIHHFLACYKKKCIYSCSFAAGLLSYTPSVQLFLDKCLIKTPTQRPSVQAVVEEILQAQNYPYVGCIDPKKVWENEAFIAVYLHADDYLDEVCTWVKASHHTTRAYRIVQLMMDLLSAKNYALFLEACSQAFVDKKMEPRMLIVLVESFDWHVRLWSNWVLHRPAYFMQGYKDRDVQEILHRIKQNPHLPLFFKKCIADVASGKVYMEGGGMFWETHHQRLQELRSRTKSNLHA